MQSYARIRIHFNTRDIFLSRKLLIVLDKMSVGRAEHSKFLNRTREILWLIVLNSLIPGAGILRRVFFIIH